MQIKCLNLVFKNISWFDFFSKDNSVIGFFNKCLKKLTIKLNFKIQGHFILGLNLVPCLFFIQQICMFNNYFFMKVNNLNIFLNLRKGSFFGTKLNLKKKFLTNIINYLWFFKFGNLNNFSGFLINCFDVSGNFNFSLKNILKFLDSKLFIQSFVNLFYFFKIFINIIVNFKCVFKSVLFFSIFTMPIKKSLYVYKK